MPPRCLSRFEALGDGLGEVLDEVAQAPAGLLRACEHALNVQAGAEPHHVHRLGGVELVKAAGSAHGVAATLSACGRQAVVAPQHNGSISPNDAMKTRFANEQPDNPLLNVSWAKTRWTKPTDI